MRRKSRVVGGVTEWRCSKCEEWRPASGFNRKRRPGSGLASHCRMCTAEARRRGMGYTAPKSWGLGLPRRGSDWVAEARADEGPGRCVVGGEPLPPGRRVLCGDPECERVYQLLHHQERRAKAKERRALNADLPSGR